MKFKEFIKNYSYVIVRIFVDQLAVAVFALAVAIGTAKNFMTLTIFSSIFSVLFFAFMIGHMTYQAGVVDREKIALGRFKKNIFSGLIMGALANIPNFLLAVLYAIGGMFEATKGIASFANIAAKLIYGEYLGLLSIKVDGVSLGLMPISYFVIIIPALIATTLGYIIGVNGIITPKVTKKDME